MSAIAPSPYAAYAANAPALAAERLRAASALPASVLPTPTAPMSDVGSSIGAGVLSSPLASLLAPHIVQNAAPQKVVSVHPATGVTTTTTMPTTKAKTSAAKAASPNVGNEISSGDLIDAYNQEASSIPGEVQSIYAPIANSLQQLFQNRSNVLQNAINSYTPIYGNMLGQYAPVSQANTQQAMESQAAIDNMLQAALGGQGAASSAALAKQIASTGVAQPVADALEGTQAARYAGEQGAAAAGGASSLSQLLGQGANAADYGAKLPGIAGASGLLATRQGQAQITNDEMSALQSMAQNEGQTSGQLYSDLRQALNNMGMLEMYYGPRGIAAKTTAGANVIKANAATTNAGANVIKANAAKTNAAANTTRAGAYAGGYLTAAQQKAAAAQQNANTATSRAAIYAKSVDGKLANGGFTPAQVVRFKGQALTAASIALHGSADGSVKPMNYTTYLNYAQQHGIPTQIAAGAANQVELPGSPAQQAAPKPFSLAHAVPTKPFNPGQAAINSNLFSNSLTDMIRGGGK